MYARLSMFRLKPDAPISFAEQWAEKTYMIHRSLKGFKGIIFFGEEITNEFGAISYWETKEDALAAGDAIEVKVYSTLSKTYIESPPMIAIYGVYDLPKGNGELIFSGKFNW
jgi:heme-degrading monooxygenase HmoA